VFANGLPYYILLSTFTLDAWERIGSRASSEHAGVSM
jgi:hypothetical protein